MDGEPLTYGSYLRVPELTALQTPLSNPAVPDEMLFIISQQAQELWFKQILHDLSRVVAELQAQKIAPAVRLLDRINRVMKVLGDEMGVMETLPPAEFARFRGVLRTASGFESEQFRELELASGLDDEAFLRLAARVVDLEDFRLRWPQTLSQAFEAVLSPVDESPPDAVLRIYAEPDVFPELYALAEALSEYDVLFATWRFRHLKLVERVIGDRAAGTGGSAGSPYLARTLEYRFFPDLWSARNRLAGGRQLS